MPAGLWLVMRDYLQEETNTSPPPLHAKRTLIKMRILNRILQILVKMSYFHSHERDSSFTENLQNVLQINISYVEGESTFLLRQYLFP